MNPDPKPKAEYVSLAQEAVGKSFGIICWASRCATDDGVDPHEALDICEAQCAAIRSALGAKPLSTDMGPPFDGDMTYP